MIRVNIVTSFRFERDDLDYTPVDAQDGLGKTYLPFGDNMNTLIDELDKDLTA